MTTNAGAISVSVTADSAQFESSMDRSAAAAERMSQRTQRAQQAAQRQGEAFTASIQRQIDTFGMTSTQLLAYEARLKGVGDQAAPLIARLERMKQAQDAFNAAGKNTGGGDGIAQVGKQAQLSAQQLQQVSYQLNDFFVQVTSGGAPLTALIQQGSQLSGTFGGIGGAVRALVSLITPTMIGLTAIAGVAGAVGLAYYKGNAEQKAFVASLALTGNMAGQTQTSFDALSSSIGNLPRNSIGPTREALQLLISTGQFTSTSIGSVTKAVLSMSQVTGRSTEEVVKDFASMTTGVARWAEEHNRQYHYVTAEQVAYIRSLEAQGRTQEAVAENSRLLGAAMDKAKGQLGNLALTWELVTKAAGRAWDAMKGVGKTDTIGQQLVAAQNAVAALQREQPRAPSELDAGRTQFDIDRDRDEQQQLVENLKARLQLETVGAAASSRVAEAEQKKIEQLSAAHQAALGSIELAGFQRRMQQDELARAQMEIGAQRSYDEGHLTLAGFMDVEYKIRKAGLQSQLELTKAEAAAASRVQPSTPTEVIEREARLTEIQTRRIPILQKMAQLEEQRRRGELQPENMHAQEVERPNESFRRFENTTGSEQVQGYFAQQAEARAQFIEGVKQQNLAVDAEIAKLNAERLTIGLSTIEREKATAVAKLQAQADKSIEANGGERARILEELADRTARLTGAMQANYEATRTFDAGVTSALRRYQDDAANAAKFSEGVISGSLSRLEDALLNFTKTGKLNLGSLWKFMSDEFIKNWIRMQIAQATTSSGGWFSSLMSIAGSLFGSGGGTNTANGTASGFSTAAGISGGRAAGGPVDAGKSYMVGERGPEVLRMGAGSGTVIPNSVVGGGGRSNMKVVINAPAGTQVDSQQESDTDDGRQLEVFMSMVEKRIAGNVAANRSPLNGALKSRGVSQSGGLPKRA